MGRQPACSFRPAELERGGGYVIRCNKGHTLRRCDRCWKWPQERRASIINFPTDQHGIVLVHCVVAVLHEHSTPVTELHGGGYASTRTQTIDALAALLPGREVTAATVTGRARRVFK